VKRALIVALASLLGLLLWWSYSAGPTRSIYLNTFVVTMDPQNRIVQALGVEGDRIGAVGSYQEVIDWAGPGAQVVDLGGGALLPGFIDAHGHFPGAGMYAVVADLNSPPVGSVKTMDDLVSQLADLADERSGGSWIVGMGYDDTLLEERRHPTRADLDRASTEHPIVAWHISLHLAVLNSAALEQLEIDASTPDPEGGVIRRQPGSLEPDGVLEENATDLASAQLGGPSLLDGLRMLRAGSDIYHRAGVTSAQSGFTTREQMQGMRWASRLGLISLRLILWPGWETADEMLDGSFQFESSDPAWLRTGAVKLIADGSIQGYTGYLSLPYHVPPADDPSYRGYPRIPRPELIERVERYHRAGLQIAAHGNGDAAIDDILDAFELAQRAHPREDSRHIVIHAQMAREDQLDRMQELGIIPSFFSLHTYYWGDRHRDIFMGPERAARMSPARSALERGMVFTIHADTPVVPMEPLRLVWSAVRRQSVSGAEIGPEQRIPLTEALRAVTINAAYQHFEEKDKGSIEVGKLADFVLLSELPSDHPERVDRIPEIRVLETIIGGETVYRAERP
jgi:hypothetical protein